MTNEELAELERLLAVANAPYDNYGQSLARKAEFSMAIFNAAPSLIATAREAEALRAENARLREALRVYAGPMEWTQEGGWGAFPVWADGYPGGVYVDDNTLDYGDAARAALKENPNAG